MTENEIAAAATKYLHMSEDQLYVELGRAVDPPRDGKQSLPAVLHAEGGRIWFRKAMDAISPVLCNSVAVKACAEPSVHTHEKVVCVCVMLETVAHPILKGAPLITLSVLLVRLGLYNVCKPFWEVPGADKIVTATETGTQ